jgi:hypothetical protein
MLQGKLGGEGWSLDQSTVLYQLNVVDNALRLTNFQAAHSDERAVYLSRLQPTKSDLRKQ